MLTIKLSKRADKALGKIQTKQAKQIAARIKQLADDPGTLPTGEFKGYAPWRRAKSGEYCIICKIDGDILRVALVGKRNVNEIYRLTECFLRYPVYFLAIEP